jgi:ABC-type transport system involved in cytochrome c biogenesis permease subunit
VFGISDRGLFALAVLLYGLSTLYSVFLYRDGFRRDNRTVYLLLLGGMLLHTVAMAKRGFSFSRCPVTNLYEATTFTAWTVVATYLGLGLARRLRFLGAFASPLLFGLGVFALMPQLDEHGPQPQFAHGLSSLHASLILLAYGAFGVGAVAALMYVAQQRDLKQHRIRALAFLPSIQRLDAVAGRALGVGLGLLSIGLVLGMAWLKREKGVYFQPDAKVLWAYGVWVTYALLVLARWRLTRSGRQFAWGTIGAFGFLLLTFWGTNLLSRIHNP